MKIAIMQPYIFPYIGYFQLISSVDTFVIYDDVSFIKQGWINRNRILLNGQAYMFNIKLKGASSFKDINDIEISGENSKLIKTIEQGYKKAPFFSEVFPIIRNILSYKETNLAEYLINSLHKTIDYLGINVSTIASSKIRVDTLLSGEDKVLDICKKLNATHYVNAIGGTELYSKNKFLKEGVILNFIQSNPIVYTQFKNDFIPWLSIIDVMMFNSPSEISKMLNSFKLLA